jgi:DNA repair protein RadC
MASAVGSARKRSPKLVDVTERDEGTGFVLPVTESSTEKDQIVRQALAILEERLRAPGPAMTSPQAVRDYLKLKIAELPHEVFVVLFLDSQHRLIACEELFRGTLAQTSVYPREVVKAALAHNAAAVIFAHNHPSGVAEPSRADELLTQSLKQALALVDIRTLDHFVVAGTNVISFSERGLI